jgi:hypothetical protein
MNVKDHIPALQVTAVAVLPGMKQARSLLEITIRVLEYFEKHVASDVANRTATPLKGVDPSLLSDAEQLKALLSAFGRLHARGD